MSKEISALEAARLSYRPRLPEWLRAGVTGLTVREEPAGDSRPRRDDVREHFPLTFGQPLLRFEPGEGPHDLPPQRVGVVLSGGQAPGGHNVIAGLLDGIRTVHGESRLTGFLGGPRGIFTNRHVELTVERVEPYRNTGGFDLIGSGRDKIETAEQLAGCERACERLGLGALVIVGGDDSNTNAAVLAEHFRSRDKELAVIGVPKTIDGDLRSHEIELSFGFDTACKVYGQLIGNICRDSKSAGKYWHFVKLMGRSASHVTLECALQTRPNHVLIGEEVRRDGVTLRQIVGTIADLVERRSAAGKGYGVCLVPEGLIEFIPEMRELIDELNHELAGGATPDDVAERLTPASREVLDGLPERVRGQLLLERDSHGNVQVSLIETETLLVEQVAATLAARGLRGKFAAQKHFLGYEGRCSAPSNFDADYTYGLGWVAAVLAALGKTGYMAGIRGLAGSADDWKPVGVPITSMIELERRKGELRPVIAKALVDLEGKPFRTLVDNREHWANDDVYVYPGPIQYFGPAEVADAPTRTLVLERG